MPERTAPLPPLHPRIAEVTQRVRERSAGPRARYLARIEAAAAQGPAREGLSCTNLAHGFAAAVPVDKDVLRRLRVPNLAIVSAYNDMLSAHQPFERFRALIKQAAREAGAVAQFAEGVPAMCDGVTQGYPGMELSLWSRDVIAMSTAVALAHNMFDAALCLRICDKIVPGLLMGALAFGHLPVIFVPGGPMPSGVPNKDKARVRQLFAEGKVGRDALLESEAQSYHGPGTCTFYGTANSNQMLMEVMGLHLPGAAFVTPNHQDDVMTAYKMGQLARDVVAVVRFQGPRANGMPELHKLTPAFTSLQDQGFKVALVTDGRMSGASGAAPAAIHVTPECAGGGALGRVRDGDVIRLDSYAGMLEARVPEEAWARRAVPTPDLGASATGFGRELFAAFRAEASGAEEGAVACMR